MNEWERIEKERKLRKQAEATGAFINMILDELTEANEIIKSSIILLTKPRTALDTKTYLTKAEEFLNKG